MAGFATIAKWLLGPEPSRAESSAPISLMEGPPADLPRPTHLFPRWLFLRFLAIVYFSAFYSLIRQITGLMGPNGILPASEYLEAVAKYSGSLRFWYAPTLFWFSASDHALMAVTWIGLVASVLLFLNLWPRAMLLVCLVTFLAFVTASQDFSGFQSDGMLLSSGFISLFFAPPGFRPGLGRAHPPSRASLFLLLMVWFSIYFESGLVKILSGDKSWRNFTAMDDYYQNGPLPTWLGWYVEQFPHGFHAFTVGLTFALELFVCWLVFLPRKFRIVCFLIVTPFQIGIILTANYAFLNYLVFFLGFLLLDDRVIGWLLERVVPRGLMRKLTAVEGAAAADAGGATRPAGSSAAAGNPASPARNGLERLRAKLAPARMTISGICLGWVGYTMFALLVLMVIPSFPFPEFPIQALDPFRIANRYGLFAVMTHQRYEIEFQGSRDGKTWIAYAFRYKPQDPTKAPGIYAPYQPRFDWCLWFASLGPWREYPWVVYTEERLLRNSPEVLELFAANPFGTQPATRVRTVLWQYWFTDKKIRRETGLWWRRELLGNYSPALGIGEDGRIGTIEAPAAPEAAPSQ